MTTRKLTSLGRRWMRRLGMPEWIAGTRFEVRRLADCHGESTWRSEERTATVTINRGCPQPEETLVHELLHLLIEGHRPGPTRYDPGFELALNRLTKTLMEGSQK